jgi:hypothetical protein
MNEDLQHLRLLSFFHYADETDGRDLVGRLDVANVLRCALPDEQMPAQPVHQTLGLRLKRLPSPALAQRFHVYVNLGVASVHPRMRLENSVGTMDVECDLQRGMAVQTVPPTLPPGATDAEPQLFLRDVQQLGLLVLDETQQFDQQGAANVTCHERIAPAKSRS